MSKQTPSDGESTGKTIIRRRAPAVLLRSLPTLRLCADTETEVARDTLEEKVLQNLLAIHAGDCTEGLKNVLARELAGAYSHPYQNQNGLSCARMRGLVFSICMARMWLPIIKRSSKIDKPRVSSSRKRHFLHVSYNVYSMYMFTCPLAGTSDFATL